MTCAGFSFPVKVFCKARWSLMCGWQIQNPSAMAFCCCLFLTTLFFASLQTFSAESKISDVVYNLSEETEVKQPSVFLAIIARNAAHLLPNWLGYIENLDYPKNRISVWWVYFPGFHSELIPLIICMQFWVCNCCKPVKLVNNDYIIKLQSFTPCAKPRWGSGGKLISVLWKYLGCQCRLR